jgi:hypothetical protein
LPKLSQNFPRALERLPKPFVALSSHEGLVGKKNRFLPPSPAKRKTKPKAGIEMPEIRSSDRRQPIINNWTIDWIFTANSGTPIGLPNSFAFNCPQNNNSYLPKKQTYTQWLYNETPSCFTPLSNVPYTPVTVIPRVSYIRAPYVPQLAMAVAKQFVIREGLKLQFKAEAFNLTNTPLFGGPSTANPNQPIVPVAGIKPGSPGSFTGYGTIGSTQQNFPRQVQMSLKLIF